MIKHSVSLAKEEETEELEDGYDDTRVRCDVAYHSQEENPWRGNWPYGVQGTLALLGAVLATTHVLQVAQDVGTYGPIFLAPYAVFLILLVLPVLYLEKTIGQFSSCGVLTCWMIPIFKAIGVAVLAWSVPATIVQSTQTGTDLYYLHESVRSSLYNVSLPWAAYEPLTDHAPECTNVTIEGTTLPEDVYYSCHIRSTVTSDESGSVVNTPLVLSLLIVWIVTCMVSCLGVPSIAWISTLVVPVVIVTLIVLAGLISDVPSADMIWRDKAGTNAGQMVADALYCSFSTLLETVGIVITYSSYNRFHNDVTRDAVSVVLLKFVIDILLTTFLGGLYYYKTEESGNTAVSVLPMSEAGYFTDLPHGVCYAITFFIVMFLIRLLNLVAILETILTAFTDQFTSLRRYRPVLVLLACIILFLLSVPMATTSGQYLGHIVYKYLLSWLPFIVILAIMGCFLTYGILTYFRHRHDVAAMTRWNLWCVPSLYVWFAFSIIGIIIVPLFILGHLGNMIRMSLGDDLPVGVTKPDWASKDLDYCLIAFPLVFISLTVLVQLVRSLFYKKPDWKTLFGVVPSWNPDLDRHWVRVMRYRQMNPHSTNNYEGWRDYTRIYKASSDRLIEKEPDTLPIEEDQQKQQTIVPFYI